MSGKLFFLGLNITIPYKKTVIPLLDVLSDEAKAIGSINTVQIINNKLVGHNTDVIGFENNFSDTSIPIMDYLIEKGYILLLKYSDIFMIHKTSLDPIVYTKVEESGVELTIRYLCKPRERRDIQQVIWESVLNEFSKEPDIEFAYPTERRFTHKEENQKTEQSWAREALVFPCKCQWFPDRRTVLYPPAATRRRPPESTAAKKTPVPQPQTGLGSSTEYA